MTMAAANSIPVSTALTYTPPAPSPAPNPAPNTAPAEAGGPAFGDILSDLNPLQYLPVVGTIYRAVTGDTIPEPVREAGSVLVSGLMGGPVGVATSIATLAFQKLTGIDFEEIGQSVLSTIGAGITATATATATAAATPDPAPTPSPAEPAPWTKAQLAAYGVATLPDGTLRQGSLTGADVLNALQLQATAGTLPTA